MTIVGARHLIEHLKHKKSKRAERKDKLACYKDRDNRVLELGYAGYQDYLKSDDWKKLREKVLQKHPNCLVCNNPATQVHHMNYTVQTLLGLHEHNLVSICGTCHEEIEYDGTRKLTVHEARRKLIGMAIKAGKRQWLGEFEKLSGRFRQKEKRFDRKQRKVSLERKENRQKKKLAKEPMKFDSKVCYLASKDFNSRYRKEGFSAGVESGRHEEKGQYFLSVNWKYRKGLCYPVLRCNLKTGRWWSINANGEVDKDGDGLQTIESVKDKATKLAESMLRFLNAREESQPKS